MKYKTIIFDFDGTLADTQALALDIVNVLAPEFGFAPIALSEVPTLKKCPRGRFSYNVPVFHLGIFSS